MDQIVPEPELKSLDKGSRSLKFEFRLHSLEWNQKLKNTICTKKATYLLDWLQKRAEPFLHSRYAEARKSAALTMKRLKMQCWENFGHKLGTNCWQANEVF